MDFTYAKAAITHFWRIEDEGGASTVHTYELDAVTSSYVATGIHRGRLKVSVPFPPTSILTPSCRERGHGTGSWPPD
ncbi:hypothetical protein ACFWWB_28530 [Streptomyces sp. NPDC058690]|uniref:hypothetical protein n=1 Tax=Streptomyces sp. NPDC058690 TaxID=3346600 RepID=UPI00364F4AC4